MTTFNEFIRNKKKTQQKIDPKGMSFNDFLSAKYGVTKGTGAKAELVKTTTEKKDTDVWFKAGAFDDGYQAGDLLKTVGGTLGDAGIGILKGATGLVEGVTDLGQYLVSGAADLVGADDFAEDVKKSAQDSWTDKLYKPAEDFLDDYSVLGDKADNITQGLGYVGGILLTGGAGAAANLGTAGTTALTMGTTFLSSTGGGMSEAYQSGATDEEAVKYGLAKGGIDATTEMLFGGLGKGLNATGLSKGIGALDDKLANALFGKIKNEVAKNSLKYGLKAAGEGVEEAIAGYATAHAKQIYSEEDINKLLEDENLFEQFITGAIVGGIASAPSLVKANASSRDYVTNLTQNEQKVVDAEVKSRIKEQEKKGKKLTNKEISNITKQVQEDLKKGGISTDIIERTLGGETYKNYQSITEQENSLNKKIEDIQKDEALTPAQKNALTKTLDNELKALNKTQVQGQLMTELDALTQKDTYLRESYNEKGRRSETFKADLSKYDDKHKAVIQKAIDSGILNNTNKTHDFVDFVAKVSADTGTSFDFANNQKIKESGFALEGATVDGYVTKDGITLNVQSNKSLNTVVGHEITHVLEGTDLYDKLQTTIIKYAQTKGDYKAKMQRIQKLYTDEMIRKQYGKDADAEAIRNSELTADLVGEYLFTDSDFVSNLSAENPSLFKKIYEEIKHLFKLATAGSKEARELEQVKKAFDKAYKSSSNTSKTIENIKTSEGKIINTLTGKELDSKTYEVLDRLNKGETVNPNEIANLKEVEEGKLKTEELLNEFIANNPSLKDVPSNEVGTILLSNEERLQLREKIITERLNEGSFTGIDKNGNEIYNGVVEKGKRLDIVIGLPASGKSSSIVNPLSEFYKSAVIDSDIIKKKLPEYNEGWGSTLVHEESSMININLLDETLKTSSNIVLPIVGSKVSSVEKYISLAKDYGYSINVHLNELPNGKAVGRLLNRYFEEGRFINPTYAATYGNKPTDVYEQIKTRSDVDGYSRWNNDVAKGQRPKNTEISENNRVYGQYSNSWRAARREDVGLANSEATQGENTTEINDKASSSDGVFFDAPKTQYSLSTDNKGRTLSKEQQEFFKDSKVVDADGRLLELYHGSTSTDTFTVFDTNMMGKNYKNPQLGKGFYFTTTKESAKKWAKGGKVYNVYLNMKKPFIVSDSMPVPQELLEVVENGSERVKELASKSTAGFMTWYGTKEGLLQNYGYDGIILKADENSDFYKIYGDQYVVFDSNQIKKTTAKKPTSSDDIRYSLSEDGKTVDSAYLKAVETGDMETAQKMVDDVAKKAGYNIRSYHGTLAKDFTEFKKEFIGSRFSYDDKGFFFIDNKEIAEDYATSADFNEKGRVLDVYLKVEKPLVVDEQFVLEEGLGNVFEEKDVVDVWDVYSDFFKEEADNHKADGIILDDGKNKMTVVFNPRQIKSAESVTYDNYNNVIPLSRRFGYRSDIRYSLSRENEDIAPVGNYNVYGSDIALAQEEIAPVREDYTNELPDDYAPLTEEMANERDAEIQNIDTLDGTNIPDEIEAPIYSENDVELADPFEERDIKDIGNRKVKAYMYDNPEVKPYFQQEAQAMLWELQNSVKGEKHFNDQLYYDTSGEQGWFGTKRETSDDIAYLLDNFKYTYADIEKGLKAIIEDHGAENNAISKRIEFALNDRLKDGYTDFMSGETIPANQDYVNLLMDKQISSYSDEAYNEWVQTLANEEAPVLAPLEPSTEARDILAPTMEDIASLEGTQRVMDLESGEIVDEVQTESDTKEQENKIYHKSRKELKKALIKDRENFLIDAMDDAKDLPTLLLNNTDTIRVTEMVFGRDNAKVINKEIFQRAIDNESKSIAWQNKERAEIKELGIKPHSKESAAVQKYGEKQYEDASGKMVEYGDFELEAEFSDVATQQRIKNAARVLRSKYDRYIDEANAVLTELGFNPIKKRKDYMRHFEALNDAFSRFGIPFNVQQMKEYDLPTDINGLTDTFVPQKNFFANIMQRKGNKTTLDAITGIDGYIGGISNLIHHTEDIQRGRAFEDLIRDNYGRKEADKVLSSFTDETARQKRQQHIADNHLSSYASWVHDWTDNLAGKKDIADRGAERRVGRRIFSVLDTIRKQVGANMIGFNVASSLTNLVAPVQAIAKTDKVAFAKGTVDTFKSIFKKDNFMDNNSFLTARMGTDKLSKTAWEKTQDAGFIFMKGMDYFTSNLIVRSKYNELISKGVSEEVAHREAGQFAARIMGDRTKGANAQLYNSKLFNMVGQFQLEVNNQLYSMFYDTYHESKEKAEGNALRTASGMTFTLGQLFIATHIFGQAFESIAGYNPTFDIIDIIKTALGLDDEEEEKPLDERLEDASLKLLKALPYSNLFVDGGRIPMGNALPITQLIKGEDEYGNEKSRWETLAEALPYYFAPAGYGQVKKTTSGLGMFDEELPVAGSYTDSGNLRFPVDDTLSNRVQAAIFGQWASENARDYFENERQPLKSNQIQEFAELDIPIKEYWEYREGLKEQKTIDEKFDYIAGLDLPVSKKNILINNVVDREEEVDLALYDDFSSYEEFDYAIKNPEKYEVVKAIGYDSFKTYSKTLSDLKTDKDANGKTINGSRKKKVVNYLNSIGADYGTKILLYKMEYPSDNRYNNEIVEYLNNRNDISYNEMASILRSLGFTVDADGTIHW